MKWHVAVFALCLPFVADAGVTSVTLFPSHAQLVWKEKAEVTKGSGQIVLTGLPASMDDNTVMAEIEGLSGTLIQQVQIRQVEQAEVVVQTTRNLREELLRTEQKIGASEDQIQAWNQQVRLMTEAASAPGEVSASELTLLAATIQESTQEALSRIRDIRRSMADDLAERDRIKRELASAQQGARATKTVTIVYRAGQSGEAIVAVRYQSQAASWRTQYSARLTTNGSGNDGTLVLEHLASIRQNTGTDWVNAELVLSTANARLGTGIPPLQPWIVVPGSSATYRSESAAKASLDMMSSVAPGAEEAARIVNDGAFTQSYRVPLPVTLASTSSEQQVMVADHRIPVAVETRFFPVMDLNGFIYATGQLAAEAALPAGPVMLYRDGQAVGRSYFSGNSGKSELTMGFGVNERVVARIVNEQNQKGEQGIFKGEKYVRRINRYEITNNHPRTVAIRVFDRIPVSQQDELTVQELDITQPVKRNAQDIKGVLSWERSLKPDTSITLRSGFEVRVPEDAELPPEFR